MIDEQTIREMVRRVVLRTVQAAADVSTPGESRLVTQEDVEGVPAGGDLAVPDGAIVTPLARQVALERGVNIVGQDSSLPQVAEGVSASSPKTVALAADHGGFELKNMLGTHLQTRGLSCMVANKIPGVRAAMCYDEATAVNSREHNDANVLTLGAGLIGEALAKRIVDKWLDTPHGGGRHARRVGKIMDIERRYLKG
jgi:ribose 5-phosphate isomerase RpiB